MKLTQAQYDDLIEVLADAVETRNRDRTRKVIGRSDIRPLLQVWIKLTRREGVEVTR